MEYMGLDTQTMLKAEKGLCRPCRQSKLRKRQIARDREGWLTKISGEMSGLGRDMIFNEEDSFASESIPLTEEEKKGCDWQE